MDEDAPFVIARKLLRRRHVRKEQLRKDREAREELKLKETRGRRKRKAEQLGDDKSRMRHSIFTASTNYVSLPQLSPMLSKSDSFSEVDKAEKQTDAKNASWNLHTEAGSNGHESKQVSWHDSVGRDEAFQIAPVTAALVILMSPITVPFSPLRSRAKT